MIPESSSNISSMWTSACSASAFRLMIALRWALRFPACFFLVRASLSMYCSLLICPFSSSLASGSITNLVMDPPRMSSRKFCHSWRIPPFFLLQKVLFHFQVFLIGSGFGLPSSFGFQCLCHLFPQLNHGNSVSFEDVLSLRPQRRRFLSLDVVPSFAKIFGLLLTHPKHFFAVLIQDFMGCPF